VNLWQGYSNELREGRNSAIRHRDAPPRKGVRFGEYDSRAWQTMLA